MTLWQMILLSAFFQYFHDFAFVLAGVAALFRLLFGHEEKDGHECWSVAETRPKIIVQGTHSNSKTAFDALGDVEEEQNSFLMKVSSPDVSASDIKPTSNFDRLKAQSKKTVQILIDNRRRMNERTPAARIKRERIKRAYANVFSRYYRF